jgi:hypothetical protein
MSEELRYTLERSLKSCFVGWSESKIHREIFFLRIANFLEFQTVIKNLDSFESSSLDYIISKAAVIKWNQINNFQEKELYDDEGERGVANRDEQRRCMELHASLQPVASRLSGSVQACCGGTLSGSFQIGNFDLSNSNSFYSVKRP